MITLPTLPLYWYEQTYESATFSDTTERGVTKPLWISVLRYFPDFWSKLLSFYRTEFSPTLYTDISNFIQISVVFFSICALDFHEVDSTSPYRCPFVTKFSSFVSIVLVPVWPHSGGLGLCEMVQHLSIFDYICVSPTLENKYVKCLKHFLLSVIH